MNILAILGAAALTMEYVSTNYAHIPSHSAIIPGQNITIEERDTTFVITYADYGVHLSQSFTITTNWVDDPVDSTLQLGIIYSNIIARVSYEGKTNELTMASKLVGLAGSRAKPPTVFINGANITNLISTNIIWLNPLLNAN